MGGRADWRCQSSFVSHLITKRSPFYLKSIKHPKLLVFKSKPILPGKFILGASDITAPVRGYLCPEQAEGAGVEGRSGVGGAEVACPGATPAALGWIPARRPGPLMFNLLRPAARLTSPRALPGRIPGIVFPQGRAHLGVPGAGRKGSPSPPGSASRLAPPPPAVPGGSRNPGCRAGGDAPPAAGSPGVFGGRDRAAHLPSQRQGDPSAPAAAGLGSLTPLASTTAAPPHPKEGRSLSPTPREELFLGLLWRESEGGNATLNPLGKSRIHVNALRPR